MRLSPLKKPSLSSAAAVAVGPSRAAVAPARAMLSTSAAALKSFTAPPASSSARNGAVAQATASSSGNGGSSSSGSAQRRRPRRRIASSSSPSLLLSSSRRDAAVSTLLRAALPTATSPSSEASSPRPRQRSPKVMTTSSAVPAPPSLQQRASSPSASALLNRAPLPAPPADGAPLAHEIIKGSMLRNLAPGPRQPPTVVLVHGILGSRRNLAGFANRLLEGFPHWQALLVDLRCHGGSARCRPTADPSSEDGVSSAAADVLALLQHLKLFPEVLIGHSFGGKVVMSMADQFGRKFGGAALPRNVHVWVLDALPGEVRGDGPADSLADHPARLLDCLRALPTPLASRNELQTALTRAGFSVGVARWAATNLAPLEEGDQSRLGWSVDLEGIAAMYDSYEKESLWDFLENPAPGVDVSFVRAARSEYRWAGNDQKRIQAAGHGVHLLPGAGHWVHAENPDGLFELLAPSFGASPDLHVRRASPPGSPGMV